MITESVALKYCFSPLIVLIRYCDENECGNIKLSQTKVLSQNLIFGSKFEFIFFEQLATLRLSTPSATRDVFHFHFKWQRTFCLESDSHMYALM